MSTGTRKPRLEQILVATGVSKLVGPIDVSDFEDLVLDVRIAATVALATTTLTILGGNGQVSDGANEATLTSGTVLSTTPTGFAYANGVITPTNVGAVSHLLIGVQVFPQFLYLNWVYGSGGGTLDVRVTLSAW